MLMNDVRVLAAMVKYAGALKRRQDADDAPGAVAFLEGERHRLNNELAAVELLLVAARPGFKLDAALAQARPAAKAKASA